MKVTPNRTKVKANKISTRVTYTAVIPAPPPTRLTATEIVQSWRRFVQRYVEGTDEWR